VPLNSRRFELGLWITCMPNCFMTSTSLSSTQTQCAPLNRWPRICSNPGPTLDELLRHIMHIAEIGGEDSIGIGPDLMENWDETVFIAATQRATRSTASRRGAAYSRTSSCQIWPKPC
jgi:microsomal dipeptidase-like Zn-dependent dipeptidase